MGSFTVSSILLLFLFSSVVVTSFPLSTNSRWIVDDRGQRVKLACVNWASHMEPVLAEGLSKQPMDTIAKRIVSMGFNCVRFTWPLYLITNDSLASLTVRQSFQRLHLLESIAGIEANNPSIIDVSLIKAFQTVVSSLGENKVMVILDNHISKPGWCCSNLDDNGFFGDKYFDPDLWITGLTRMATLFNGVTNVVGMSLRNEPRGPKQNVNDWYKYMPIAAEAVHKANPNVLVILSGLSFDRDLSFIQDQGVKLTFSGKLVYEAHWYGFSDGQTTWLDDNPNEVCGRVATYMIRTSGYLVDQGYPLFIGEFGIDQSGSNVNGNRYMSCFLGVAAELDLDWALWTLVGSYYTRAGVVGLNEHYGAMDYNWCGARNSSFIQRISSLQSPFRGPGLSEVKPHKVIYHPLTGLCITRKSLAQPLRLGPCTDSYPWNYSPQKNLVVQGTRFCLQTDASGTSVKLGILCTDSNSKWEMISDSKMHLSAKLRDGKSICLDVASDNTIIANRCKCISKDKTCDPSSQWFKLVDSTRSSTRVQRSLSQPLPGKGLVPNHLIG
ncbi:hypothetical protein V6N13_039133 [Hibiscus sabdariffa]|uniref:Glycoside hydrolase family 5 domain-containing protein n=1 Tax=Hibiscus sabdariffa TaxID=183260 RepID=A0ABR2SWY7_9ROSI